MANRFWVGGTATWDATADSKWSATSGGAGGSAAPTAADDVFFDASSSGTITTSTTSACRSLNFTGFTGTFNHATASIDIGDATAGAGNIALKLAPTMIYNRTSSTSSGFRMISTSATVQTLTFGGKTTSNINFVTSGSWQITDAWTTDITSTVTLTQGILDLNGQTCSWGIFSSTGSTSRTLITGSATINLTGTGTVWNSPDMRNFPVSAASSTVNVTGIGAAINLGITVMNTLVVYDFGTFNFTGTGSPVLQIGSGPLVTVVAVNRTGTAVKGDSFIFVTSGLANSIGSLSVVGNSAVNRMLFTSNISGTPRTFPVATPPVLTNVDFQDIVASGPSTPWTGTSLGDQGGNSGITFDTPLTLYRVGAASTWSNSMWSLTSGGATGARVPLPQDNVFVDSGASGTIIPDMIRLGRNIDFTGFTGTFTSAGTGIEVFGNLTLGTGMTMAGTPTMQLRGRDSHAFTTNGVQVTRSITLNCPGGTYNLADPISSSASLTVTIGTFNDNGYTATFSVFVGSGNFTRGLIKSGTWTLTGTGSPIWNATSSMTLTDNGSIIVAGVTASGRSFIAGGHNYGSLIYTVSGSTGALVISQTLNTTVFGRLEIGPGRTVTFPSNVVTTVNDLVLGGALGDLVTINSSTPGTSATLSKATGVVSVDYVSIQDSAATGGAAWYAGSNSIDASGNTGWIFSGLSSSSKFFEMFD